MVDAVRKKLYIEDGGCRMVCYLVESRVRSDLLWFYLNKCLEKVCDSAVSLNGMCRIFTRGRHTATVGHEGVKIPSATIGIENRIRFIMP